MAISSHYEQEYTVLTVDHALYCRLIKLKWSVPVYQDKLIPRLGGLHISVMFLKAIGDHRNGSGLARVWVESGLLGQGTVVLVLAGKAYNKVMRAHELTLQALWHLLMPSHLSFVAKADEDCHVCISRMATDDDPQKIPELITFLDQEKFWKLLDDFAESRSDAVDFSFWWQYMDMVAILLHYT